MAKKDYKRRDPSPIVTIYNKTQERAGCPAGGTVIVVPESNPSINQIGKVDVVERKAKSMVEQAPDVFTMVREEAYAANGMVDAQSAKKVDRLKDMSREELIAVIKFQGYESEVVSLDGLTDEVLEDLAESWAKGLCKYPEAPLVVETPKPSKPAKAPKEKALEDTKEAAPKSVVDFSGVE